MTGMERGPSRVGHKRPLNINSCADQPTHQLSTKELHVAEPKRYTPPKTNMQRLSTMACTRLIESPENEGALRHATTSPLLAQKLSFWPLMNLSG